MNLTKYLFPAILLGTCAAATWKYPQCEFDTQCKSGQTCCYHRGVSSFAIYFTRSDLATPILAYEYIDSRSPTCAVHDPSQMFFDVTTTLNQHFWTPHIYTHRYVLSDGKLYGTHFLSAQHIQISMPISPWLFSRMAQKKYLADTRDWMVHLQQLRQLITQDVSNLIRLIETLGDSGYSFAVVNEVEDW